MSKLTLDGTAETVSRDQILRHERGQGNNNFPVQLTTSRIGNLARLIHVCVCFLPIHSGHQVRWTYQPGSHRRKVTYSCYMCDRAYIQHVCVCVFFPFILDIKFVGRTSRGHTGGRSHRIFNPPSFCGACLDFSREKDSAIPFPRRP